MNIHRFSIKTWLTGLTAGLFGLLLPLGASAEDVIRAVTFLPSNNAYSKSFAQFVDRVNREGKGVVRINILGGPEVISTGKQGEAQQKGTADMFNLPAGLYINLAPEGEALAGSNHTPWQNRDNGGWDLLNEIFHKKSNSHALFHIDAGTPFYIYLTKEPRFKGNGDLDLSGIRLRSSPLYRTFFEQLDARIVVLSAGEVYTSLQRGVVDGTGWPVIGFLNFKWQDFVKYRITPGFFQTDVLVSMNYDKWRGLSRKSRNLLEKIGKEYERDSYNEIRRVQARDEKEMARLGIKDVEVKGGARTRFLKTAYESPWQRIRSKDASNYSELRKKFLTEIR